MGFGQARPAAQARELGHKAKPAELPPGCADQLRAGSCCAARRQQIIDDQHLAAAAEGIALDLQAIGAVLEGVVDTRYNSRQLAGFAHRHKAQPHSGGQSRTNDEAARLDPHDQIGLQTLTNSTELSNHLLPALGIAHQRRQIAKQDARLGEIGDLAHQAAQVDRGGHGPLAGSHGIIAAMASPTAAPLPRRGIERLDLMLLCAEALDLNGAEATLWLSEELGLTEVVSDRVELWKQRCHNPLRRHVRRGSLTPSETDALIQVLCSQSERLYPLLRALLSAQEPLDISQQRWALFEERLRELIRERLNPRRSGVQTLLDPVGGAPQRRQLIRTMALAAGQGGFERLKASLMDASS